MPMPTRITSAETMMIQGFFFTKVIVVLSRLNSVVGFGSAYSELAAAQV